ncbi:hypothetical protein HGA92_02920 [Candidatus Gracilibacteria bacterium]|nr:hypothetical protein [Candidatus Gracilibacteria bacterium]NUJ98369.1 hypothetical protein [Candidatus Gracilibacteria bacterium]
MKKQKTAFTFVELIITSVIIIMLSTLGFFSYSKHISTSRDAERMAHLGNINSSLNLYKQKKGAYPLPGDNFSFTNLGLEIVKQGKMNEKMSLSTLDSLPLDPYLHIPYIYSITQNRQEFQIGTSLENNGNSIALLYGSYKTVAKNILPSIMIAHNGSGSVEITDNSYKNKFIVDGTRHNLPYNLENGIPFSDGIGFSGVIDDINTRIPQNRDFENCNEIYEAGKSIGNGEYQILNSSGSLDNISCIFP